MIEFARRIVKRSIAGLFGICLAVSSAGAAAKSPVILISVDTLRADHLSAYGYTRIHTPNIDAFANKGTIYTRADSQIPLTLPSHTTLMTSTYPFANQVEVNDGSVPAGAVTLASVLHANGYSTAAFIGSVILDHSSGLDQGFDFYDSPFEDGAGQTANPYSGRVRRDAALVTRAARQWIDKNRAEPFFAFIHLYDLHTPYALPQLSSPMASVAGYDAELEYIDQALGRLRESLISDGVWDKSLVILLADHGEGLGDHGEARHGYFIYESTMHVPLIVHWPAADASKYPERVDEPAGLIDVAPTILDFLQIPLPRSFAGVSLLAHHGGRETYGESVYLRGTFGWADLRSLQSGAYKYIQAPRPELYDLSKDPGERVNILTAHPDEVRLLNAEMGRLMARYPARLRTASSELSAHTRDVLGSLGYTAGGRQSGTSQLPDPKDKLAEHEAYETGLTWLYAGNYDKAKLMLQKVVTEDPGNLPALCALGESYLHSGDSRKALALWQQALERNPAYFPAAQSIGDYWLAQKDYEKACRFLPAAPPCKKSQ